MENDGMCTFDGRNDTGMKKKKSKFIIYYQYLNIPGLNENNSLVRVFPKEFFTFYLLTLSPLALLIIFTNIQWPQEYLVL